MITIRKWLIFQVLNYSNYTASGYGEAHTNSHPQSVIYRIDKIIKKTHLEPPNKYKRLPTTRHTCRRRAFGDVPCVVTLLQ